MGWTGDYRGLWGAMGSPSDRGAVPAGALEGCCSALGGSPDLEMIHLEGVHLRRAGEGEEGVAAVAAAAPPPLVTFAALQAQQQGPLEPQGVVVDIA